MERLLYGPGWRREEQRYQPPSSQRIARTPALSRGIANAASAPTSGHSSRHVFPEMPLRTTNEKELLRGLNERFAGFIETVRRLENQNKALEKEIEGIRLKANSATTLANQYEPELQDLRRQVRETAMQKHQMELEHKRVQEECKELIEKCEEVARSRGEAEESITALKKYTESAYLYKQEMDRRANALADEIEFLKRNHEAEVSDIWAQTKETRVCGEVRSFGKGELTAALRDIRTQLEGRAFRSDTQSEQHYSKQLVKLTKAAEKDRETLIATKAEIRQNKRQLQSKTAELDSFRGMREALEKQLYDLEQRHTAEIHRYQDTIRELEQELKNTKYDMNSHVQEYHDLLNVKMALDAEIYSYRKLLEGEESRYSTLSDAHIPGPYVYRQSPIYTLPTVPRVGGVSRKAEPQYKFVEEIITETTSEDIEISDAGSDDADEQKESDKVCCEKENESVSTGREEHLEDKMSQESDAEDSLKPEHLDNVEIATKKEEQSLKIFTDVSTALSEDNIHTELAQNDLTTTEQIKEKDTDHRYNNVDNTVSETKENVLDTETQKDQSDDADVEKKEKQEEAQEIDQDRITAPKPAEKTAISDSEPKKSGKEEISAKSIKEKAKNETQHAAEHEGSSAEKTLEKVKSVGVDTSGADSKPVSQTAEAGQETHAKSEADSMETAEADVLNTTNAVEVQKSLAEKVKTETLQNNEIKEIQPKEETNMDQKKTDTAPIKPEKEDSVQSTEEQQTQDNVSKPDIASIKPEKEDSVQSTEEQQTQDNVSKPETASIKPEKEDSVQSTEEHKTQDIDSKPAADETAKAETPERKESRVKELMDSEKTETNIELNKIVKDQVHIKQQDKVLGMETKSEEQAQKSPAKDSEKMNTELSFKTEENTTKSSETPKNEIRKDKETKDKQIPETQVSNNHETSTENKEIDKVKSEGQKTDGITAKNGQPEQSILKTSLEKKKEEDQTKTDKDTNEIEDTKTEKSHETETKQDTTKIDMTTMKDFMEDPTPDSKKPESPEKDSSETGQDDSTNAGVKRERDVEAVTEYGVDMLKVENLKI